MQIRVFVCMYYTYGATVSAMYLGGLLVTSVLYSYIFILFL